jgi:hypothetical protein
MLIGLLLIYLRWCRSIAKSDAWRKLTFFAVRAGVLLALFLVCAPVTATILVHTRQQHIVLSALLATNTFSHTLTVKQIWEAIYFRIYPRKKVESTSTAQAKIVFMSRRATYSSEILSSSSSESMEGTLESGVQRSPSGSVHETYSNTLTPSFSSEWTDGKASSTAFSTIPSAVPQSFLP